MQQGQNIIENSGHQPTTINFVQCIKIGNAVIVSSFLLVALCIAVTFFLEQHFSLAIQISAHIGTIIFAAILKIGYVIRCIGAHGLGHQAF